MYSSKPACTFGFHGLDKEIGEAVLNGKTQLQHSRNSYDWLGHGVYFWENSLNVLINMQYKPVVALIPLLSKLLLLEQLLI